MEVTVEKTTHPDQPLTMPLLSKPGLMVRWHVGTILSPFLDPDGWYGDAVPKITLWYETSRPRPFISWRVPIPFTGKHWRGYFGWKVYGVIDHYIRHWLHPKYLGGHAMFFSLRPFSTIDADKAQA